MHNGMMPYGIGGLSGGYLGADTPADDPADGWSIHGWASGPYRYSALGSLSHSLGT